MRLLIAGALQGLAGYGMPSMLVPQHLTPQAQAVIAPVAQAYAKVGAAQARLPPPVSNKERLLRVQALDQAGREVLNGLDLSVLPTAERKPAMIAIGAQIARHDVQDQAALKAMTPNSGWFPISVYGRDGQLAAWVIVQHATNDPALMRSTVAVLDRMRRTGEATPQAYAIMYDRVALDFDHKPQRYGTQLDCIGGDERPKRVEDPAHLDARRKTAGFDQTEADYVKSMDDGYCRRTR